MYDVSQSKANEEKKYRDYIFDIFEIRRAIDTETFKIELKDKIVFIN